MHVGFVFGLSLTILLWSPSSARTRHYPFVAERRLMCTLCERTKTAVASGRVEIARRVCKDFEGNEHSTICQLVMDKMEKEEGEDESKQDVCTRLGLCSDSWEAEERMKFGHAAINETMIEEINEKTDSTWVAGINSRLQGMTIADVRRELLGSVLEDSSNHKVESKRESNVQLPTNFDVRTNWPFCANVTGLVRDQSACAGDWAFSMVESLNDVLCINSKGSMNTLLSPQDMLSCCNVNAGICGSNNGCQGGSTSIAGQWSVSVGVVSGGNYGDKATCYPYVFPPCSHYNSTTRIPPCPTTNFHAPACTKNCTNPFPKSYAADKHKALQSGWLSSVESGQYFLTESGSFVATMLVFEDFLHYKSGVYKYTSGPSVGGLSVKIIGWGEENGEAYWLAMNSWNVNWGNEGLFKIARGINECHIEENMVMVTMF